MCATTYADRWARTRAPAWAPASVARWRRAAAHRPVADTADTTDMAGGRPVGIAADRAAGADRPTVEAVAGMVAVRPAAHIPAGTAGTHMRARTVVGMPHPAGEAAPPHQVGRAARTPAQAGQADPPHSLRRASDSLPSPRHRLWERQPAQVRAQGLVLFRAACHPTVDRHRQRHMRHSCSWCPTYPLFLNDS